MHFIYKTLANWDGTQVASDIVKLLTNDLNISGYSVSCDKASTSVLANTVSGGWSLNDSNTGTANSYVLSSTEANGITPKYIRIFSSSSTIWFTGYGTWNNVTHVGTKNTTTSGVSSWLGNNNNILGMSGNNVNPITIMIWQAPSYIAFICGVAGGWNSPMLVGTELDRSTCLSDYFSNTSNSAMITTLHPPRGNYNGLAYLPVYNATTFTVQETPIWATSLYPPLRPCMNIDNSTYGPHIVYPMYINNTILYGAIKDISILHTGALLSQLDEVNISGTLYSILRTNTQSFLIPKV